MEPLIWSPRLLHEYRALLEENQLDPRRIGADPAYFDEFPIFTRDAQLAFLSGEPLEEQCQLIFMLAVRFWMEAEANLLALGYPHAYALFLSIWEWEAGDWPVPYVFFCGQDPGRVSRGVELGGPTSQYAAVIRVLGERLGLGRVMEIYEDGATVEGSVRVLVDFHLPAAANKQRLGVLAASGAR